MQSTAMCLHCMSATSLFATFPSQPCSPPSCVRCRPSYNVAFFPRIYNASGYPAFIDDKGHKGTPYEQPTAWLKYQVGGGPAHEQRQRGPGMGGGRARDLGRRATCLHVFWWPLHCYVCIAGFAPDVAMAIDDGSADIQDGLLTTSTERIYCADGATCQHLPPRSGGRERPGCVQAGHALQRLAPRPAVTGRTVCRHLWPRRPGARGRGVWPGAQGLLRLKGALLWVGLGRQAAAVGREVQAQPRALKMHMPLYACRVCA